MPRKNKYKPGEPIPTIAELIRELSEGRYVYERQKPQHPSWLLSRHLRDLILGIKAGVFKYAKENQ